MTPNEIKAAIVRAGTNQTAMAAHLGVTRSALWRVVNGNMRSAKIESALEKLTGKPIHSDKAKRGRQKSVWNGVSASQGATA